MTLYEMVCCLKKIQADYWDAYNDFHPLPWCDAVERHCDNANVAAFLKQLDGSAESLAHWFLMIDIETNFR